MVYSFLKKPAGKELLLLIRKGLIFDSPMHTGDNGIRMQCLAHFDVFGDNSRINIVHDIGRSNGDSVGSIRIVEQGDTKSVLF